MKKLKEIFLETDGQQVALPNKVSPVYKKIDQMKKLEDQGRQLWIKLYELEAKWEKILAAIKDTPEWKEYTDRTGTSFEPRWHDMMA